MKSGAGESQGEPHLEGKDRRPLDDLDPEFVSSRRHLEDCRRPNQVGSQTHQLVENVAWQLFSLSDMSHETIIAFIT